MKKIILNGCSWVAGDEIVWDKFCIEKGLGNLSYYSTVNESHLNNLRSEYRTSFRPKFNQAGILSNILNTEVIDLSRDGNSNDSISMTTINYLLGIPRDERKNYHVIIAWSILTRKLLYLKHSGGWDCVHLNNLYHKDHETKMRIINSLTSNEPPDWYLNYFINVFLLQNYLELNNITYTFYRSLGNKGEFFNEKGFMVDLYNNLQVNIQNLTPQSIDNSNWLTFNENEDLGFVSDSWTEYCYKHFGNTWYIRDDNKHPTLNCTTLLCEKIKNYLIEKNLLS